MKKIVSAIVVLVLLVGGFGAWFLFNSDDSLDVSTREIDTAIKSQNIEEQDSANGKWEISEQDDVFVGYEIQELFGGDTVKKTAVAKTTSLQGNLTILENKITQGEIIADLTQLQSDSSRRDSTQRTRGLQTDKFPQAVFKFIQPQEIGEILKNVEKTIEISGELTLHGVTKPITVDLNATWDGRVLKTSGELKIILADYEIEPPQSSFVEVDDTGTIKLQLLFVPSK